MYVGGDAYSSGTCGLRLRCGRLDQLGASNAHPSMDQYRLLTLFEEQYAPLLLRHVYAGVQKQNRQHITPNPSAALPTGACPTGTSMVRHPDLTSGRLQSQKREASRGGMPQLVLANGRLQQPLSPSTPLADSRGSGLTGSPHRVVALGASAAVATGPCR
jgi:hypothetical protein